VQQFPLMQVSVMIVTQRDLFSFHGTSSVLIRSVTGTHFMPDVSNRPQVVHFDIIFRTT